jgi:Ca2+/Na+ antiporter
LLKILDLTLPVNTSPIFSFLIILLIFFVFIDFILTVVSVLSMYTHLSHLIIALTFISWSSSTLELINITIAARTGQLQLGLSSILSSIVLTFVLILPLAVLHKMYRTQTHQIQMLQHSSHIIFAPCLVMVLVCIAGIGQWGKKGTAWALIAAYIGYIFGMVWYVR